MKSVLFCLLGIALVGTAVAQVVSLGKGCSDAEAEKCNLEFLTFGFSSKLPDTASKLADYCKKRTKALQCALNYTDKCLIGVYRGTAFTAINTMREENDRRCNTSHVEHTEFLQHSKCLNKAGDPIHKCIVNFKKEFYTTAVNAERKDRIRYGCCDYTKMFHCREKNLARQVQRPPGHPVCPQRRRAHPGKRPEDLLRRLHHRVQVLQGAAKASQAARQHQGPQERHGAAQDLSPRYNWAIQENACHTSAITSSLCLLCLWTDIKPTGKQRALLSVKTYLWRREVVWAC
nr:uncharacterized protein LOC119167358 [Rhipicephalus microplus]